MGLILLSLVLYKLRVTPLNSMSQILFSVTLLQIRSELLKAKEVLPIDSDVTEIRMGGSGLRCCTASAGGLRKRPGISLSYVRR